MTPRRWEPVTHSELADVSLDDVLHALADPARRELVRILTTGGDRVCGTFELDLAAPTLSHHFRILREACVILQYDDGRKRMNTLRTSELDERFPGLLKTILANASRP